MISGTRELSIRRKKLDFYAHTLENPAAAVILPDRVEQISAGWIENVLDEFSFLRGGAARRKYSPALPQDRRMSMNAAGKKLLFISERAGFSGGIERFIFHTASLLRDAGFTLYGPAELPI